jgi:WD40 repeat protein
MLLLGGVIWIGINRFKTHPAPLRVTVLALSSSGRWLASGTSAGRISVWDRERPEGLREISETHGPLNDLRFSPNEEQLAVASKNITLIPVSELTSPQVLRDDQANYGTARFTADGRSILTITGRGAIEAIEVATGKATLKGCCSTIYGEVAFSPDDSLILSAGHWPAIWDFRSGVLVTRLTKTREFLTFGPIMVDAARSLVYMGNQDGRVHVWDLQTRQRRLTSPPQPGYVSTITVVGQTGWIAYAAFGDAVRIWNPETGENRLVAAARTTSNLLFDASSNLTVLGTDAGRVEFWDLIDSKIQRALTPQRHSSR